MATNPLKSENANIRIKASPEQTKTVSKNSKGSNQLSSIEMLLEEEYKNLLKLVHSKEPLVHLSVKNRENKKQTFKKKMIGTKSDGPGSSKCFQGYRKCSTKHSSNDRNYSHASTVGWSVPSPTREKPPLYRDKFCPKRAYMCKDVLTDAEKLERSKLKELLHKDYDMWASKFRLKRVATYMWIECPWCDSKFAGRSLVYEHMKLTCVGRFEYEGKFRDSDYCA